MLYMQHCRILFSACNGSQQAELSQVWMGAGQGPCEATHSPTNSISWTAEVRQGPDRVLSW